MIYPIGIQSFEIIRKEGYVYVDKTALIHEMVSTGMYYFLSRPRRFGKSLLVSTMDAYFNGRKELFEGLRIAELEKEWIQYPVLHLDLSVKAYDIPDVLEKVLDDILSKWESQYGCVNRSGVPGIRFGNIIQAAFERTGKRVVVLVDEYDKPILDIVDKPEISDLYTIQLQGFYSVLKEKNDYIQFAFLTGVTKIGKLSIFSGLNNLIDISMDRTYADICGISQKELVEYFSESVHELAVTEGLSDTACMQKLEEMYDGYHFHHNADGVYNPFSLFNTLKSKEFGEYWFATGTPTFLIKAIKDTNYNINRLEEDQVGADDLTNVGSALINPVSYLYQSGYLTLKGFDPEFRLYKVGFPNKEVKDGFLLSLLNYYVPNQDESANSLIAKMIRDVRDGRPDDWMRRLQALFAKTPYQIQGESEKDFQYAMLTIINLMGEHVKATAEKVTSEGRIDIQIETEKYIYIVEIKTNDSVDAALKQIDDKHYSRQFADDPRRLFKIGVKFSSKSRGIDEWRVV